MGSIEKEAINSHPYNPSDLKLPGYVPNHLPISIILEGYLLAALLAVLLVWIASGFIKKISKFERALMCWWIFTGLTHIILESYYVFTPEFYKDKTQFFLAEVWKEFSKGDSRYVGRDSMIVSIEGITIVLVGFPALLAIYAIATKKSYRYLVQLVSSLAQLFCMIVYFMTAVLDGDDFAASPYYYYTYYIMANSFWVLMPIAISIYSWMKLDAAVQAQDQELLQKVKSC